MNKNKTFLDENGKIVFSKFSGLESKNKCSKQRFNLIKAIF